MSIFQSVPRRSSALAQAVSEVVLPVFGATIFLSALLLFTFEPMFAKMALPLLGGAPAVWSVAMVFFQALMLAGYLYAHLLMRFLPLRTGALVHAIVLLAAGLFLPITLRFAEVPPVDANPTFWLIRCLSASIGLPFFALAGQGPLLQAWFAQSGHRQARDPYFLYAASNIGSFAALLAYPFLVEPLIGLGLQGHLSALFFALCAVLVLACAAISLFVAGSDMPEMADAPAFVDDRRDVPMRLWAWIGWSFVPSALLVSVTAHISTDVAAAPLLWVIPLGLFLLSFVITFRERMVFADSRLPAVGGIGAALALVMLGLPSGSILLGFAAHLCSFLCIAVVCGRALYLSRPDASRLTLFYAITALGGALGGIFAGLMAPYLFSTVAEYPLLVLAAVLLRPGMIDSFRATSRRDLFAFCAVALLCLAGGQIVMATTHFHAVAARIAFGGLGALMLFQWRSAAAGVIFGGAMAMQLVALPELGESGENFRSFFGISRVLESRSGEFRALAHGTTMHGAIRIRQPDGTPVAGRPMPTTYYHPDGPLGSALNATRTKEGGLKHVALVGLGAGAMACHMRANEAVTYYEIDPVVVRLASDPARFRFLSDCTPQAKIVFGDARLTLAKQAELSDFILIDAFSSDAIPVHLLTREALALYVSKLAPHGVLVLHTSNKFMEFHGLIAQAASELGLKAYERRDLDVPGDNPDLRTATAAVALVRDAADAQVLKAGPGGDHWIALAPNGTPAWTDEKSSILTAIAAKWRMP